MGTVVVLLLLSGGFASLDGRSDSSSHLPLGDGLGGGGANVATISGAVEHVTTATGGAVDGGAPGAGATLTQVGSGVGRAIGDAGDGVSGPLN